MPAAARWPCADAAPSKAIAFAVVGATNGWHDGVFSFVKHVMQPLMASDHSALFTVLKPIAFGGERAWLNSSECLALEQRIASLRINGTQHVLSRDTPAERYRDEAERGFACAFYPHYADKESGIHEHQRELIARWWGALDMAWDLIARYEHKHAIRFEQVVVARADLHYAQPLPCASYDSNATFFTSREVPDAFWIMSHDVAARAMRTIRTVSGCGESDNSTRYTQCCEALRSWRVSWYIPCFWARAGWATGLRLATLRVPARVDIHSDTKAKRLDEVGDTPPDVEPLVSPYARGSQHPQDCFPGEENRLMSLIQL